MFHRLGHSDEARKLLERLRQLLQQDRWKNDAESQALLREAEAMIAGSKDTGTNKEGR